MKDIYNPSQEDILEWAMSKNSEWPDSDWDLYVTGGKYDNDSLVLELASDKNCPHRKFFVHALYNFTGDFFHEIQRHPNRSSKPNLLKKKSRIEKLISLAKTQELSSQEVQSWVQDVEDLFIGKLDFDYNYWIYSKMPNSDDQ